MTRALRRRNLKSLVGVDGVAPLVNGGLNVHFPRAHSRDERSEITRGQLQYIRQGSSDEEGRRAAFECETGIQWCVFLASMHNDTLNVAYSNTATLRDRTNSEAMDDDRRISNTQNDPVRRGNSYTRPGQRYDTLCDNRMPQGFVLKEVNRPPVCLQAEADDAQA